MRVGGRRRWGAVGVAAAVAAGGAAVATAGEGFEDTRVSLTDGGAWLASPQQGMVTLINGPAQQLVGSVPAPGAQPGDQLQVVQSQASAYVVNGSRGTVARVDGATYQTSAPVQFGAGDSPLSVYAGGDSLYVVDSQRRTASVTDPVSLRVRETLSLAAQPGPDQSVVDAAGRLWVIDQQRGGLTWFDPAKQVRPDGAGASDRLVLVQDRPVLVDVDGGRLGALSDAGEVPDWSCLDVRAGDQVQLLGSRTSPRVYGAVAGTGTLTGGTVGRDDCSLSVSVGTAGDELGALVESGRFVFVPNRTSGRTVVVDIDAGRVAADLAVVRPGARLELLAKDGFVFYNDLDGDQAGVITFEGGQWQVGRSLKKYDESGAGDEILAGGSEPSGDEDPAEEDPPSDEDPSDENPSTENPPGSEESPGEDPPGSEDPPGENPPGGEDPPGEDPPGEDPPGSEDPPGEDPPGGDDPATVVLTAARQGPAGTLTATPDGGATVPCDPMCSVEVEPGTAVTLQATADSDSAIAGWTGVNGCAKDATCTVTVDDDRSVAVVFLGLVELTVTVSGDGAGTVIGNTRSIGTLECPPTCTATVEQGDVVTLTAEPGSDAEFGGWGGDCSGTETTCTITMDRDRTVSATFDRVLNLNILFQGRPGRVVGPGVDCDFNCSVQIRPGTRITLTGEPVVAGDHYGWAGPPGGDCVSLPIDTPCTFTMNEDKNIGVNFFQS